jgi:hypothetical protein
MSFPPRLERADLMEILSTYHDQVGEHIDSLELAWLLHQMEQRYGVELELDDDQLARMSTVSSALEVLRGAFPDHGND